MSCLPATFTLTPRSPIYQGEQFDQAWIACYGADIEFYNPDDLSTLYANNQFRFISFFAADATKDYTRFSSKFVTRFIELGVSLPSLAGTNKQLALIFGFATEPFMYYTVQNYGDVLIYSDAGFLQKQTLQPTDNQFLLEMDVPASELNLYFIHAGGDWYFNGISGYVV